MEMQTQAQELLKELNKQRLLAGFNLIEKDIKKLYPGIKIELVLKYRISQGLPTIECFLNNTEYCYFGTSIGRKGDSLVIMNKDMSDRSNRREKIRLNKLESYVDSIKELMRILGYSTETFTIKLGG